MFGKILITISVAYIIRILYKMGIFESGQPVEDQFGNCKYFNENTHGPEDIAYFNQTTLIFSSGDFLKLFEGNPQNTPQGGIHAIFHADTNPQVKQIQIVNFPINTSFHPHGIYIKQSQDGHKYLYVINHAFSQGGERVERFRFEETDLNLKLIYTQSILMDQSFNGGLNDLVVINENQFLITQYQALQDPKEGRNLFTRIANLAFYTLEIKSTYVYFCNFRPNLTEMGQCKILEETLSIMNNGITIDNEQNIYIANTFEKLVKVFRLTKNDTLELVGEVGLNGGPDNIEYDAQLNKLYIGSIFKFIDHLKVTYVGKKNQMALDNTLKLDVWAQAEEIDLNKSSEYYLKSKVIFRSQNGNKGTSGAYVLHDKLYLASWIDRSIVYCERK